jgi:aspartyl protease family protein
MRLSTGLRNVLRETAGWLLAAIAGMVAVLYLDDVKSAVSATAGVRAVEARTPARAEKPPPRHVEIRASGHGHFLTTVTVNGQPVEVLVDTGASFVALSYEDALRAGVYVRPADFTQRVATANGVAKIAPIVIDSISIGDILMHDVHAAVSEPGRLGTTLLGMTFLGRLSRAELRNGILILEE